MAKPCLPLLAATALHAALIHGVVVENQTGRPLARALVTMQPVAGASGGAQSVRTDSLGAFEFAPVAAGAYLVTASRRAFAAVQYGQRQWRGAGVPVVLEQSASVALSIRLPRLGAITGALLDENDVGLPDHDVVAYRLAHPPQLAARAKTDDRGIYRISGLEPGKYLVRTLGKQYEEGAYLPTFFRETAAVDQAFPLDVDLDRETADVNVRPAPGKLFAVAGRAVVFPPMPVNVTLVSDMGTESTTSDTQGNFQFNLQPPGQYELSAQAPGNRLRPVNTAYQPLALDRDQNNIHLTLNASPTVVVKLEDATGAAVDPSGFQILVRHKDLSGDGRPETLRLANRRAELPPGRWDFALSPTPAGYAAAFSGAQPSSKERADGWNEVLLPSGGSPITLKFVISPKPATLHGMVTGAGREPAPGAPVFLEPYDVAARKPLGDLHFTRTDLRGQYYFYGLAPGDYLVVSSFEFQQPDSPTLEAAGPKIVRLTEGKDEPQDLDLYAIP